MSIKDNYNFAPLVNEAENLIIEELGRQLELEENEDMCKCQDCILDIVALALNNVKPAYRSTFTGVIYAQQLHTEENIKLYADEVRKAIEKVRAHPSHD